MKLGDVIAMVFGTAGVGAVVYGIILATSDPSPESGMYAGFEELGSTLVGWGLVLIGATAVTIVGAYIVAGRSEEPPPKPRPRRAALPRAVARESKRGDRDDDGDGANNG